MLIVDAQIHLWSQGLPTNALHRQIPSYSAEECLMEMDNGGVQAALIHPPGWDPNSLVVAVLSRASRWLTTSRTPSGLPRSATARANRVPPS